MAIIRVDEKRAKDILVPGKNPLTGRDDPHGGPSLPIWTKTAMVRYNNPGKGLEKTLLVHDPQTARVFVLEIPQEHQGKTDVTLVIEPAVVDGKSKFVVKRAVSNFPNLEKFFLVGKHGQPLQSGDQTKK